MDCDIYYARHTVYLLYGAGFLMATYLLLSHSRMNVLARVQLMYTHTHTHTDARTRAHTNTNTHTFLSLCLLNTRCIWSHLDMFIHKDGNEIHARELKLAVKHVHCGLAVKNRTLLLVKPE